jgi:hypothetical protein
MQQKLTKSQTNKFQEGHKDVRDQWQKEEVDI